MGRIAPGKPTRDTPLSTASTDGCAPLGTHVVINAIMAALQKCAEAFDAVGVGHAANTLTDRMVDGQVVEASAGWVFSPGI